MAFVRETINLKKGGLCIIYRNYLSKDYANSLFVNLQNEMPWSKSELTIYGKKCLTPRFQCWMANADVKAEVYSNTRVDWNPDIVLLKERIEKELNFSFNYLLLNYYKTGDDYISYHSDMEVLCATDLISSLSLGGMRRFLIRGKQDKTENYELLLNSGDLMIMDGSMQYHYKHSVPKTKKLVDPRINLTFRKA
jgi:alkylated DNA repair dioxygenase AlkB